VCDIVAGPGGVPVEGAFEAGLFGGGGAGVGFAGTSPACNKQLDGLILEMLPFY
jgi:hypothetical protein